MADQYVQTVSGTGTTTVQVTLNGVVAGNALVAFGWDGGGTGNPATATCSDAQGSYTAQATTAGRDANSVFIKAFVLENANSGTHSPTLTLPTGDAAAINLAEIGASGAGSTSGENAASQSGPGTTNDAVSSGSVTVTGACTIVAVSADTAVVDVTKEPASGTGFTSRDSGANTTIGSWRLESGAFSSNHAGTFTAITGTDQFITAAVAIKNPAGSSNQLMWVKG